jgi:hypothetical protein
MKHELPRIVLRSTRGTFASAPSGSAKPVTPVVAKAFVKVAGQVADEIGRSGSSPPTSLILHLGAWIAFETQKCIHSI